jgi:sterol desaturase/sphingolipid hydroxylase (fatty acid hydroxylase superfamily)
LARRICSEHGNFDLPRRLERGLARVLAAPALHRLPYARAAADLDSNFGTIFSGWDRALGAPFAPGAGIRASA